jgi:hypothetical protein
VVDDAVTSAIYVAFQFAVPEAFAGAFCVEDGNRVFPVFHGQAHVPDEV